MRKLILRLLLGKEPYQELIDFLEERHANIKLDLQDLRERVRRVEAMVSVEPGSPVVVRHSREV